MTVLEEAGGAKRQPLWWSKKNRRLLLQWMAAQASPASQRIIRQQFANDTPGGGVILTFPSRHGRSLPFLPAPALTAESSVPAGFCRPPSCPQRASAIAGV